MQTYTVKVGDSLSKIALQFYGDYTLYNLIAKANNISNINLIHPGDVLTIPDKPQTQNESVSTTTHTPDEKKSYAVYWWVGGSLVLVGVAIAVARRRKKRKKI